MRTLIKNDFDLPILIFSKFIGFLFRIVGETTSLGPNGMLSLSSADAA